MNILELSRVATKMGILWQQGVLFHSSGTHTFHGKLACE